MAKGRNVKSDSVLTTDNHERSKNFLDQPEIDRLLDAGLAGAFEQKVTVSLSQIHLKP